MLDKTLPIITKEKSQRLSETLYMKSIKPIWNLNMQDNSISFTTFKLVHALHNYLYVDLYHDHLLMLYFYCFFYCIDIT